MEPANLEALPPAPVARQGRLARLASYLPWLSLLIGLLGAFTMNRGERQARLVAVAALLGWALQIALSFARQLDPARYRGLWARLAHAARFTSLTVTQSLIQQPLFFALPFYMRAFSGTVGQLGFLLALFGAVAVTLWDPLATRVLLHPVAAVMLQALATFAGLNAVLPILGMSNTASLFAAAFATVLGLPLVAGSAATKGERRRAAAWGLAVGLVFPVLLSLRPVRQLVPAAPLKLVDLGIGSDVVDHELWGRGERFQEPAQLVCWSAISAPRGLNDAIVHVWRRDYREVDRIAVTVRGGNEAGFRTYSVKRHLGARPEGFWSCGVETASGQSLGEKFVTVDPAPPEEKPTP